MSCNTVKHIRFAMSPTTSEVSRVALVALAHGGASAAVRHEVAAPQQYVPPLAAHGG